MTTPTQAMPAQPAPVDSTPATPARRGRPKRVSDEARRRRIVEEARRLFIADGYGRTTTDHIAARCRISKQTLYHLFPGKPALFAAVVDAHRQSMLALPGDYDRLPLDEALARIFRVDIDDEQHRERVALLRLVTLECARFPELGEILKRHGAERSRADLAAWLARQCAAGRMGLDDADAAARMLMDMIFGAVAMKAAGDIEWPGAEDRRAHIRRCIAVFLYGVATRSEGPRINPPTPGAPLLGA